MRKKRRKNVDLGMIFSMVTSRQTKKFKLTDLYKMLGLNYRGGFDCVWTVGPDGETQSFETVPYEKSYDDIFEYPPRREDIRFYDPLTTTFSMCDEDYLESVMNKWRNRS